MTQATLAAFATQEAQGTSPLSPVSPIVPVAPAPQKPPEVQAKPKKEKGCGPPNRRWYWRPCRMCRFSKNIQQCARSRRHTGYDIWDWTYEQALKDKKGPWKHASVMFGRKPRLGPG